MAASTQLAQLPVHHSPGREAGNLVVDPGSRGHDVNDGVTRKVGQVGIVTSPSREEQRGAGRHRRPTSNGSVSFREDAARRRQVGTGRWQGRILIAEGVRNRSPRVEEQNGGLAPDHTPALATRRAARPSRQPPR
jgi:hypothetical protein